MTAQSTVTFRERLKLAAQRIEGPRPAGPPLHLLASEASYAFSPITRRLRRAPDVRPVQNRQIVLMLPGFIATPRTMRYLSHQIERAGHKAKQWKLGFNGGPSPERLAMLERRLLEVREHYGIKPVLLGWSLGGMFARELAYRQPDAIAKVITMGSPFSGDPRANNAWRLYQFVTGHSVDAPPVENRVGQKPPVETVALWSARDGVVSVQSARGTSLDRDRAIEVNCSHMGFSYAAEAVEAILGELERV